MKENKRIEKELLFKNNIKDITSISLDSDYKVEKKEITGNFLITGDYKIHEVSINREKFNFKIPFNHEIEDDIDGQTIKLEITNFEYDYNKDELIVIIEYEITGDRKDVLLFDNEESLEEFLNSREVEIVDTRLSNIKEEIEKTNDKPEEKNESEEKIEPDKKIEIPKPYISESLNEERVEQRITETIENKINAGEEQENKTTINEDRDKIETDNILNNVGKIDDSYVTYKVHTIKENETLESIVIKYKTTIDELNEYNDLNNLSINDKIIVPKYE